MERQAIPGAMKLPPGAKDRERVKSLEIRIEALERCINPEKLQAAILAVLAQVTPEEEETPISARAKKVKGE